MPKGLFPGAEVRPGAEGSDPDHEYLLTSVLDMIAPGLEDGNAPPLAHYDYLSEFTRRERVTRGGNGEIRRAFWPARKCDVVLKSLIITKHTPVKIASLFDKEASQFLPLFLPTSLSVATRQVPDGNLMRGPRHCF